MHTRHRTGLCIMLAFFSLAAAVAAQPRQTFSVRLSPLPASPRDYLTMRGQGRASASLDGRTLTIKGTFEGLSSAAVSAAIRHAMPGLRGPVEFPLPLSKTTNGSIETTITLTSAQVEELKRGRYYLQIDTEKNPEGHIRGWLYPQEQA